MTVGRRRTRGLTREDVAQLTGVSFKWYTLLESGAAPGVSRRFLDRVASVLRLNRAERRHLFSLLGFAEADENEGATSAPDSLRRLVDELAGAPAAVYSATFDVLHYNDAYDALFRHADQPPGLKANKVWRLFMDDNYRGMWRDWESVARYITGELRYLNSSSESSRAFQELLEQLQRNPDFSRFWNEGDVDVLTARTGHFELDLPGAGAMAFDVVAMIPPDLPRLFFAALLPSDAETRRKLARLVRRRKVDARH